MDMSGEKKRKSSREIGNIGLLKLKRILLEMLE